MGVCKDRRGVGHVLFDIMNDIGFVLRIEIRDTRRSRYGSEKLVSSKVFT